MNCPECDAVIDVPGDAASGHMWVQDLQSTDFSDLMVM